MAAHLQRYIIWHNSIFPEDVRKTQVAQIGKDRCATAAAWAPCLVIFLWDFCTQQNGRGMRSACRTSLRSARTSVQLPLFVRFAVRGTKQASARCSRGAL